MPQAKAGILGKSADIVTFVSSSVGPTVTTIPSGEGRIWKNTTDGSTKLYYNDGGTLKSLTLNLPVPTIEGPFTVMSPVAHFAVASILGYSNAQRGWFSDSRYWMTWVRSGSFGVQYSTSTDRSTWATPQDFTALPPSGGIGTNKFNLFHDGQFISYALGTGNFDIRYRQGTPQTNGTISWTSAEQEVFTSIDPVHSAEFGVTTDNDKFPFISFEALDTINNADSGAKVIKSSTNNGTWTMASGHPFQLNVAGFGTYWTIAKRMSGNKVYVMYYDGSSPRNIFGRVWSGSAWGAEETIVTTDSISDQPAMEIDNTDTVYVVYRDQPVANLKYHTRNPSTGVWSSAANAYTGTGMSNPSLVPRGNALYMFWREGNTHYYLLRQNDVWETRITINTGVAIPGFSEPVAQKMGNHIGLFYLENAASPFDIKVIWLVF